MATSSWPSMENTIESRSSPRPGNSFSSGGGTDRSPVSSSVRKTWQSTNGTTFGSLTHVINRIQVFDGEGNLLRIWGEEGSQIGKLQYPYDLVLDTDGSSSLSVSSATIGFNDGIGTVMPWEPGDRTDAARDNSSTPGPWSWTVPAKSMCSIPIITGSQVVAPPPRIITTRSHQLPTQGHEPLGACL